MVARLDDLLRTSEQGGAKSAIFSDPAVFARETERIFNRCWLLLAHETEIPSPGDFVTRRMGSDLVLVVRGLDGQVRAFLNSCRHRGMQVCRADSGNAKGFICPYHHWTYDDQGRLRSTSFDHFYAREAFASLGLVPVAQLATFHGLVFATWDPEAESLTDSLGEAAWYLEMLFQRTPGGMTVLSPPQRWIVDTNWKLPALNFIDSQHALRTHLGAFAVGAPPGSPSPAEVQKIWAASPQVMTERGHGVVLIENPPGFPDFIGHPPELVPVYQQQLRRPQFELLKTLFACVGTIFPNMSWVQPLLNAAPDQPPVSFLNLRLWQPLEPGKIECWSWYLTEKESSQEWKDGRLRRAVQTFGMGGIFEEDDAEMWSSILRSTRGSIANKQSLHFGAGLATPPSPDFAGPGAMIPSLFAEHSQVQFLKTWGRWMRDGEAER